MGPNEIVQAKADLRQRLRELLRDLGEERDRGSAAITAKILTLPEYVRAATVMLYLSLAGEFQTAGLLRASFAAGKRVCVPAVEWGERRMVAVELVGPDAPLVSAHGISEPRDRRPVDPGEVDVVLVPGLGFDLRGRRLGRAGGFYDRFLASPAVRGFRLAAAFDCQVLSEVPALPHDQSVDALVTPTRLLRFVR